MKHLGDITKISGHEVPIVDILCGGSPCQDLSIAGKRKGLDGERSGLFMEQIRIFKEMREQYVREHGTDEPVRSISPRFLVWENVKGAFSSNGGRDFQAVLTEIVRIAIPDADDVPLFGGGGRTAWPISGAIFGVSDQGEFSISYRLHDAQFWGVPQRRERIALVADFGGLSASEILFEREGLSGDSEQIGEERQEASTTSPGSLNPSISFQERSGKPGGGQRNTDTE